MNLCSGIFGKTETLADEETDKIITEYAKKASEVIISWGNLIRNDFKEREIKVLKVLKIAKKRVLAVSDGNGKDNVHILTPSEKRFVKMHNVKRIKNQKKPLTPFYKKAVSYVENFFKLFSPFSKKRKGICNLQKLQST